MHLTLMHKIAATLVAMLLVAGAAGTAIATAGAAPINPGAFLKATTVNSPPAASTADAGCWTAGWRAEVWTDRTTGVEIAFVKITQHGWCGNGYRITRDNGWSGTYGVRYPACFVNGVRYRAGWKHYPTVRHGMTWGTLGFVNAYGNCQGVSQAKVGLSITGDGHHINGY
jgi:hypothetical protein